MIPLTFKKLNLLLIFTFYHKCLKYIFLNLGIKTVLYFKYKPTSDLLDCKMEKRNRQLKYDS